MHNIKDLNVQETILCTSKKS